MSWNEPNGKDAFNLSWISVLLTLLAAIGGLVFYVETGSALCLVFGLENCVDFMSSVVVLWRFYCPGELTEERNKQLLHREKRASMAISFILILLGLGVIVAAADDLSNGAESARDLRIVLAISFVSIFIFGSLTLVKFRFANRLHSASLYKDGICSLIGTVLAASLFADTLIVEAAPTVWWLDPLVAMICGIVALGIGLHAVVVASCFKGLPLFTLQWWFLSQGDGMDEVEGRSLGPKDFGEETDVEMSKKAKAASKSNSETKLSEVV